MNFWNSLKDQLIAQKKLILLVVVESIKSSPGRQGFKMFIAPDNTFMGTIGGGVMEFGFVEKAKKEVDAIGKDVVALAALVKEVCEE